MKAAPAQAGRATAEHPQVHRGVRLPIRYSATLLLRGLVIWALARLMVVALNLFIAASARRDLEITRVFTQINPAVLAAWTLALSVALIRVDLYRRHEVALLNNLGVITSHAVALGIVPAVVTEVAMAILR